MYRLILVLTMCMWALSVSPNALVVNDIQASVVNLDGCDVNDDVNSELNDVDDLACNALVSSQLFCQFTLTPQASNQVTALSNALVSIRAPPVIS